MKKFPDLNLRDEATMRAFYASCGVSKGITEAAIKMRRDRPATKTRKKPWLVLKALRRTLRAYWDHEKARPLPDRLVKLLRPPTKRVEQMLRRKTPVS